jgi:hypothetical protein
MTLVAHVTTSMCKCVKFCTAQSEYAALPNTQLKKLCPNKLVSLAEKCYLDNDPVLQQICEDLKNGANIGCKGPARLPSNSTNAPSAFQYGPEVTDAVADWVNQGFAAGPFDPKDRPANAKISCIMCRPKPNGAARIILNYASPEGNCVNDGIDNDDFPTSMSSTGEWLKALDKCGRRALMLKIDWAAAYKHIHGRSEDLPLQYFSWLGKDFVELMLVFGARSRAGIYDRLTKFVLKRVLALSKYPRELVCQFLDDVCAACPAGSYALEKFESVYRAVAAKIGVRLTCRKTPTSASPLTQKVSSSASITTQQTGLGEYRTKN